MRTVYEFSVKDRKGKDVSLKEYANEVLLIVNTATKCGFTPQYEELEKLYETYHSQGFEILDFPCNQFGQQAPGMIISQLLKDGYLHGVDIPQLESFKSGMLFAQTEGIIPAPESCHAIAATIREALKAKEEGKEKVILFCLSGHGLIDMPSYDKIGRAHV